MTTDDAAATTVAARRSERPADAGADLRVDVAGIACATPVWTASGCCAYGRELAHSVRLSEVGALVVKGTSLEPWSGNPGPRVAETDMGLLNAIGLQNPGVDHFLRTDLPWLVDQGANVVVNVVGRTVEEYVGVVEALGAAPAGSIAGVELNISCPNVKEGGLQFGHDLRAAAEVTRAVRAATPLPLLVKLSPNVTDIGAFARAAEDAGADALTVANTMIGMRIDVMRRRPALATGTGGLSGPAIRPIAVRLVWQAAAAVSIPVVGSGGVASGRDALEFLMAGARAVQVGTAIFTDPSAPARIARELREWLHSQGCGSVDEIVGVARP